MNLLKKNLSILLVDDDEDYYFLAKEAFEEAGLLPDDFAWVRGGEELFEHLSSKRPGLILLDLNMPKMDGFQVLDKLKSMQEYRQIPVVILTTSRSDQDVAKSYSKGACSFISKPIDYTYLVDFLKTFRRYWHEIVEIPK